MFTYKYFIDPIKKQYADFETLATRTQYWIYTLHYWAIVIGLFVAGHLIDNGKSETPVSAMVLWSLIAVFWGVLLIPSLAIRVRRMHDSNHSGLMVLLWLIPYVGSLVVFVFSVLPSVTKNNKFSKDYLEENSDVTDLKRQVKALKRKMEINDLKKDIQELSKNI